MKNTERDRDKPKTSATETIVKISSSKLRKIMNFGKVIEEPPKSSNGGLNRPRGKLDQDSVTFTVNRILFKGPASKIKLKNERSFF